MASELAGELPVDVSGGALELREVDLDRFFSPTTIAIVGATETAGRPGALMTRRIVAWAESHGAAVTPVTPAHEWIAGRRTVGSIAQVSTPVDLAVLLTGAERVVDHFAEAVDVGARFAVIFSAGFAEVGAQGARLEDRLSELAAGGTRLLGPNTNLNAFSDFRADLTGPAIALITQSGHQGRPIFQGQELGVRLSHWAPTGNEADLEFADFAGYFADRPEVGVIAAYIEGFRDGRTLRLAADRALRAGTPLVVVKVGRTDEGASMARSHTGHLTGADDVVDAAFAQHGIVRVEGLDELLEVAAAFARTPRPHRTGRRAGIGIYAISGGTGAHMADMVAAAGLRLARLADSTQRALHDGLIPTYLRVSNPVDCGGPPVMTSAGRKILDLILADPDVDVLVVPITGALDAMSEPLVRDLVAAAQACDKPVFVVWGSPVGTEAAYTETLRASQLPVFRTFRNCVTAMTAYLDWWETAQRYRSPFVDAPTDPLPAARRVRRLLDRAPGDSALSEPDSKRVLSAYGVRVSRDRQCTSARQAVDAARRLGLPVVMKAMSPDIAHKTEHRLVELGVSSLAQVRTTYRELMGRGRAVAGASIEGVLVSQQVEGGVEMLVGVARDSLFGPVVTVGFGGTLAEVLDDVAIRIPPFSTAEAERMLDELRGAALLDGHRGEPAVDRAALVAAIMATQRLALDFANDIVEVDINPLLVRRRGAVALDALVVRS